MNAAPRSTHPILVCLALAIVVACSSIGVACSSINDLPAAVDSNTVDTVSLWALDDTVVARPAGYDIATALPVRTDRSSLFDFAFNVDSLGRLMLLPSGALGLARGSAFDTTSTPFDAIHVAPSGPYKADTAVVIDTGTIAILRSRPATCSFGAIVFYYAKMHVIAYDSTQHRLQFEILDDTNCGYRGLDTGLPTR